MRIWLQQVGEPLPMDGGSRMWRAAHLVEALLGLGHEVVWWASTFDHFTKRQRASGHRVVDLKERLRIEMLTSPGYRRNVSLARIRDHRALANHFREVSRARPKPDVLFTSLPPLEICVEMVRYAREHRVPCVLDVRDLWPDAFLEHVPRGLGWAARLALASQFRAAAEVCRSASAIVGVSESYVDWGVRNARRARRPTDRVFPHGYEPVPGAMASSSEAPSASSGSADAPLVAVFVGTFGRTYDVSCILRAARILWKAGRRDVAFTIAGDGEMGPSWRAEAAGLPNVSFTGWLSAEELRGLLRRARVGLVAYKPGATQTLPNKAFEYMAGGLALVNSLPGELSDLVQREGIGVNYRAGDPRSLADRVCRLLDDPLETKRMGENARALLEGRFDNRRIALDMAKHLIDTAGLGAAEGSASAVSC